ncbi:MAG: hypothetical protein VYE32_04440 [Candidatus Thermoplasmatota archaeon]|nr:hypothetical protein [Candidatus Thermoplasmatota archaeon]
MLEGKALVVAIMMLTAAPLVVTDDGRAIVGDVTRDVTDIFTDSEPLPAEDPKLDEVLDDAKDKSNEKDLELDRKDLSSKDTKEEKSCYYLEEIKEEMMEGKEGWDKEDKWETEEDFFAALEKLSAECDEGNEESCEKLAHFREELAEDREEESEEREGSRSGDETETEEDSEKEELDEEFIAEMEELKLACEDGNEESCEELRSMIAEIKKEKGDDIQLVIGDDGVVYYEDKDRKDWNKEDKDWDEVCLTMEEWKEVFEKDRKEKDGRHKHDHKEMSIEDMIEMFADMDEEDIAEIKQITNMSDEEWNQMIVKFETNNMTEEDWKTVMEKMELVFEHEMKEERAEMEAFRAQMKEFDDACEAGNETACEELSAMMEEIEEDFEEDREEKEDREECDGHSDESEEDESEEDESEEESDEDEEDLE